MGLNNKGELAGYIGYGKFNEKQKKYVLTGFQAFFWDGDVHLIPLPNIKSSLEKMIVNHKGSILLNTNNETYLWNKENGIKLIPNFKGSAINDHELILGTVRDPQSKSDEESATPVIWKSGKVIEIAELLDVENLNNLAPAYSDTYSIEAIKEIKALNNKGQMTCKGLIWGKWYPCIMEPSNKL